MSARRETYRVYPAQGGWLVQNGCGSPHLGPFADQEHAIATALTAVREVKPSQLRISNSLGEWRAEIVYTDERLSSPTSPRPDSAETGCGIEGVLNVGT